MNKFFYHFTHLDNLDSILKNGLLSTNIKEKLKISHYNVSNKSIQGRRSEMDVICDKINHGKVHDFVPFYFSTRNPMQLAIISQKKVDQPELIFLGIETSLIKKNNFIFTDASANTTIPPKFYTDFQHLEKLDWDIINSNKWGFSDEQKHKRMAEVLISDFKFEFVNHIVVFNESYKTKVNKILDDNNIKIKPKIEFHPVEGKYFYFTKFFIKNREREDLVTGPKHLKLTFDYLTNATIENRKTSKKYNFKNISDLLESLENDFCCIPETKGIFELETINDVHTNTVSEHTLEVIKNLKKNVLFKDQSVRNQELLLLSAYLHDIGKGPHSKWKNGKQPSYNDHPYDSLQYTQRILREEIEDISDQEVTTINLLVGYHDILGDLSRDFRNTIELKNLISSPKELDLLYILSQADILSIRQDWYENLNAKFEEIKKKVLQ